MSEIFVTVFDIIEKIRKKVEECDKKLEGSKAVKESKEELSSKLLEGFERRAEDAPTLLSQGLTQALTFYLYKVENLNLLKDVYQWLFEGSEGQVENPCKHLDNEGYLLYTSVLFHLLEKLNVNCKVVELPNCIKEVSTKEASIYRKLINYVIELKKISKIMISQTPA